MNTKAKGANFERRTKHYLESQGYFVARQAASLSPDLIAMKKFRDGVSDKLVTLLVECKASGAIGKAELAQLEALKQSLCVESLDFCLRVLLAVPGNGGPTSRDAIVFKEVRDGKLEALE